MGWGGLVAAFEVRFAAVTMQVPMVTMQVLRPGPERQRCPTIDQLGRGSEARGQHQRGPTLLRLPLVLLLQLRLPLLCRLLRCGHVGSLACQPGGLLRSRQGESGAW